MEIAVNRNQSEGDLLETMLLNQIYEEGKNGSHSCVIFLTMRKKFGIQLGMPTLQSQLKKMEKRQLVCSTWNTIGGKRFKIYRLSQKGQNLLAEYSRELEARIQNLINPWSLIHANLSFSMKPFSNLDLPNMHLGNQAILHCTIF